MMKESVLIVLTNKCFCFLFAHIGISNSSENSVKSKPEIRRSRRVSAKYWCFTLNNVSKPQWRHLPKGITYLVCQAEKGEKESTPHLQGYIQLSRSQDLTWIRNKISRKAHFEIMRAHNSDDARNYCMKEDTRIDGPWELGQYVSFDRSFARGQNQRGRRTDLEAFRDAILGGMPEMELWENFAKQMARYPNMFGKLHRLSKVREPPKVILLVGPTGTGKTKWFFDNCPDRDWYSTPVSNGTLWLDGYKGESWVLLDDFAGQMPLVQILRMLDRHPISVPVKGSHVDFSPAKTIVVTSNLHPHQWYSWDNRELQYAALARRFTQIFDFKDGNPEERTGVSLGERGEVNLGTYFEEGLSLAPKSTSRRESESRTPWSRTLWTGYGE